MEIRFFHKFPNAGDCRYKLRLQCITFSVYKYKINLFIKTSRRTLNTYN